MGGAGGGLRGRARDRWSLACRNARCSRARESSVRAGCARHRPVPGAPPPRRTTRQMAPAQSPVRTVQTRARAPLMDCTAQEDARRQRTVANVWAGQLTMWQITRPERLADARRMIPRRTDGSRLRVLPRASACTWLLCIPGCVRVRAHTCTCMSGCTCLVTARQGCASTCVCLCICMYARARTRNHTHLTSAGTGRRLRRTDRLCVSAWRGPSPRISSFLHMAGYFFVVISGHVFLTTF